MKAKSKIVKAKNKQKKMDTVFQNSIEDIIRPQIEAYIQELLERERDEIVGREYYERHLPEDKRLYRNGYSKPRKLVCGCGTLTLKQPRLRETYDSKIIEKYKRLSKSMKQLLPMLYLHGLSLGDFDKSFGWMLGEDAPLSPTTISRLREDWEKEYSGWKKRKLEKEYLFVWCDAVYPKVGLIDEGVAVLVVMGVNRRGNKEILVLEEGFNESIESWQDIFRDMKERGVEWIGLVIGDGAKGLSKAVKRIFPGTKFQRCWVHKMRNVLDKVSKRDHDEVLEALRLIYYASSKEEAQKYLNEFISKYRTKYPRAVQSLLEAGDDLFSYFEFPKIYWRSIRTTNPIESVFATLKLRTRVTRRLRNRTKAIHLIFMTLKESEKSFNRIRGYTLIEDTIELIKNKINKNGKIYAAL